MSLLKYFKRLQYIDYLVSKKATGDLQTFARKNNLSKSHMRLILREIKDIGFPLKYDRNLHSYYYEKDGRLVNSLFSTNSISLSREEMKAIKSNDIHNLCFSETTIFTPCNS